MWTELSGVEVQHRMCQKHETEEKNEVLHLFPNLECGIAHCPENLMEHFCCWRDEEECSRLFCMKRTNLKSTGEKRRLTKTEVKRLCNCSDFATRVVVRKLQVL